MCNLWCSDDFDETADYCIIDDFSFDFFHGMRKPLWGAQEVFTHTDKYRKGSFRWGKPMIWICNDDANPFTAWRDGKKVMPPQEEEWYRGNCVEIRVTEPLFRVAPLIDPMDQ